MTYCRTCELISSRDANNAPLWDCIYRTQFWDVVHNYQTSLPGWLVLVVRRHIGSIDELTHEESVELGILLRQAPLALKEITGCVKTYVIQFAEMEEHQHVLFHIVPRMVNLPENRRGTKVFVYSGVSEQERVSEEIMNEIASKAQKILSSTLSNTDEKASFKQE